MAIDKFIPEVWAARLTRILQPKLVIGQFCNHDYEGEITDAGDTVHIRNFSTAGTIRDYSRNTAMSAPDRASDGEQVLTIDQAKAFYIAVDDVDSVQADITIMDKFLERTARALAEVLDTAAATKYLQGAAAANVIAGASLAANTLGVSGTPDYTPYSLCVEARKRLAKQSVPLDNLWMVVNADVEALFLRDPAFISGGSGIGDANVVRNGSIGRIAGFEVFVTEAVAPKGAVNLNPTTDAETGDTGDADVTDSGEPALTGDSLRVLFGAGTYAQTWANQTVKVEGERLQGQFGDAIKGLHVYGSKVIESESIGFAVIDPA